MSLPLEMIAWVLKHQDAQISFDQANYNSPIGVKGAKADIPGKIMYNQFPCVATVEFKGIKFRAVPENDPQVNAVNVAYEGDWATIGLVDAPGYVFTGSMSGCSFYLYRGFGDSVAGVHASREAGKAIDPSPYFRTRASPLLYRWDSLGLLTGDLLGCFGAVLCCVDQATIHIYAVALKGSSLVKVFEKKKIDNWRVANNPILQDL